MNHKINILVVDDSIIFAEGVSELLKQNPIISSIDHAKDYEDSMETLGQKRIDIILLDLNFDSNNFDGFTISEKVRKLYPQIKIMIITQHAKIDHYETLIDNIGVNAYLDKRLSINHLNKAFEKVLNGEIYIDADIKKILDAGRWLKTSSREREVIDLLCQGDPQKIIADKLCIDIKTVESHILNVRKRHNFSNSSELASEYVKYKNSFRENYKETTSPFRK